MPTYPELPAPSPLTLPKGRFPDAPPALAIRAVLWLRRALLRLADLLSPPELAIFELSTGIARTELLAAVAQFRIADVIGDGALTGAEIADKAKLDADVTHRVLRGLATIGVFAMDDEGRFSNNRMSRVLESGRLTRTREWVMYFGSGSNAAAWCDFAETLRTGKSAFDRVHGMNVWDWFDAHPDERELFAHVMMGLTSQDAPVVASLYPFGEVKTLCDVGGGRGTLLSEILLRHEGLKGVLCDAEGVIASARTLLENRGLIDRVELVAGSFFDKVPEGCDAYMMKNILHDWDDATSEKILATVRRSMKKGARLILCEALVERYSREPIGTLTDLHMLTACSNGRERGREELRGLLERTGFRLSRVFPFPTVSVLEGIATDPG